MAKALKGHDQLEVAEARAQLDQMGRAAERLVVAGDQLTLVIDEQALLLERSSSTWRVGRMARPGTDPRS